MLLLKISGYGALAMAGLALILAAVEGFVPFIGATAALFAAGAGLLGLDRMIEVLSGIRKALEHGPDVVATDTLAETPVRIRSIDEIEAGIARMKAREG